MKTIKNLVNEKVNKPYLIWLDDTRDPKTWIESVISKQILNKLEIVWAKDANEFKNLLKYRGLPKIICFDHDLGIGESGFDCAKYLVEFCMDHKKTLPEWYIQSANPVGRENIDGLLNGFKNHQK